MMGYYHVAKAKAVPPEIPVIIEHLEKAAKFYLTAASAFPEDDETHCCTF